MDYWKDSHAMHQEFLQKNPGAKIYYEQPATFRPIQMLNLRTTVTSCLAKKVPKIPEEILMKHKENCIRIPMINDIRSLNLSNSVAIVLNEALRQNNFDHMQLRRTA